MNWNWPNSLKILIAMAALALASCQSVKPYQRAYLNDRNMQPGAMYPESFEQSVYSYREGSLVTGGSKSRGGCGCN